MNSKQTIIQKTIYWLRAKKENPQSIFGSFLRFIFSLYHFHPKERFLNYFYVRYKITFGNWERLTFGRSMIQRVFYVCVENTSEGKMVIKLPRGDNQFSCGLIDALKSSDAIDKYKKILIDIKVDSWMGKHGVEVANICRDGGYTSEYIEGFNLAHLRDDLFDSRVMPEHFRDGLISAINQLLADLRGYYGQYGKIIGDWPLHNLVFSPVRASIINVDAEGFFTFDSAGVETSLPLIEDCLSDIVEFLKLLDSHSPEDKKTVAVFRVLDEVRRSGEAYSGLSFLVGYHSLELNGRMFRGQRECSTRLNQVPFNFKNKVVVDLGCNSGGMLHALSGDIKKGYGFDFNPKCINAAQSVKSLNQVQNLEFFHFDFDHNDLSMIPYLVLCDKVDICFLLSVCMWIKRWREVIHQAATLAESLLFESNGTVGQQEEQMALLRKYYSKLELINDGSPDDPLQNTRKLYLCSSKKTTLLDEQMIQ